jgi:hypothetical protein
MRISIFFKPVVPALALNVAFFSNGLAADAGTEPAASPSASAAVVAPASPEILPGKGLAQHPFLYTGEWDHRKTNQTIFVVRDGKVVWTYDIPIKDADGTLQELGDATMLSNGNIILGLA